MLTEKGGHMLKTCGAVKKTCSGSAISRYILGNGNQFYIRQVPGKYQRLGPHILKMRCAMY